MKAPITDTTLGIKPDSFGKFRDVRQKAQDEYIERAKKRKKDPTIPVPKYKIGDKIVVSEGFKKKEYYLIEVVDFQLAYNHEFFYFGILLKTTDSTVLDRVGRLIKSGDHGYYSMPRIENIPPESVKWLGKEIGVEK
jgi:hypothetical protein